MNRIAPITKPTPYQADYHQWSVEQAALLRDGKLDQLDRENLAEEIESLGRSEKREIESRLAVVLQHLLKWKFQPYCRTRSWEATLGEQRRRLLRVLDENPSLKSGPQQELAGAYVEGRVKAATETGMAYEAFPEICPFSIVEILDPDFLPD
ncbi:uncharacterized protein DUF29 [Hoeflea marina]|uniref:Uncharacterized protein DUF29 n=1 Tax=Hoeflea marina TaxID=274592 RepID=A0A317PMJ8_9HYPH|nr:DUF29 domain-containing protein [Hoeflea marina]PWW01743.1 uncharacterized protein DUF29 [Hoeflea marina]